MYQISGKHGKEHKGHCKHIHRKTALPERMEKAGTDLKTYGKHEKDEAEFL